MKRTTMLAAAIVAAATLATGCGSAGTTTKVATPVTPSEGSGSAGGARASGGPVSQTVAGTKLARLLKQTEATKTAKIQLSMESSFHGHGTTISGSGAIDFSSGNTSITMEVGGQSTELRRVDGVAYVKNPMASGSTKPWIKSPAGEGGSSADPTGLGAGSVDPAALLKKLGAGDATITERPGPTIDGAATTEYDAKVSNKGKGQAFGVGGPVQVFIDGDGHLRRIDESIDSDVGLSLKTSITFSDLGAPVTVEAPPADQVTDFSDVLGGLDSDHS